MLNRIVLIGNLGADPEKNETSNGKTVVRFSLPLHNPFSKEGDKTEWMQCEVWNKTAEFLAQYGTKGSLVVVEGRLRNQRYEDKEGNTRYRTFVSVDSLRLRNNRPNDGSSSPSTSKPASTPANSATPVQHQTNQNQNQNQNPVEENIDDLFKDFDFNM
jgi:single-strand DNA-binding protein